MLANNMKNTFYVSFLLAILLVLSLNVSISAQEKAQPGDLSVKEASELIKKHPDDLLILDVRTPDEYREGHIANARNMDFFGGRFDQDVSELPKEQKILLYCRSGKGSAGAAEILRETGHKNVLHLHEGLEGWQKAGLPVEK